MFNFCVSPPAAVHLSGGLGGLGNGFLDFETSLLLEDHDLEPVEVIQSPPLLGRGNALGQSRLGPLLSNILLLPDLGDDTSAGSAGQRGKNDAGQTDVRERKRLARDTGIGRVDQDLR